MKNWDWSMTWFIIFLLVNAIVTVVYLVVSVFLK